MDTLAFRLEVFDKGPFTSDFGFDCLNTFIKESRIKYDEFNTTFLNYYDQRSVSPMVSPRTFKMLNDDRENQKKLRFGFTSIEQMKDRFGIEEDRWNQAFRYQFEHVLDNHDQVTVKAYLVKPFHFFNEEIIFNVDESEVLAVAHSYSEFLRL